MCGIDEYCLSVNESSINNFLEDPAEDCLKDLTGKTLGKHKANCRKMGYLRGQVVTEKPSVSNVQVHFINGEPIGPIYFEKNSPVAKTV